MKIKRLKQRFKSMLDWETDYCYIGEGDYVSIYKKGKKSLVKYWDFVDIVNNYTESK